MNQEQAIALAKSGWWAGRDPADVVAFQLFEDLLCMPFKDFHAAVEAALGRPVWTHEFGSIGIDGLRAEFLKEREPRTFQEVLDLIPAEKRIVVEGWSGQ